MNAKKRAFTGTKTKVWSMVLLLPLLWYGCASAPRATLPPNANAQDEVMRLKQDLAAGKANDFAVLDRDDFEKSKEHLMKAEESLKDKDGQAEAMEHLSMARGYYERADMISANRRSSVESAIDARNKAIQAGALKFPQSRKALSKADENLRDLSEDNKVPSAEKVKKLQDQYAQVEMIALEINQLGPASAMIQQAEKNDAEKIAPATLNQARVDYYAARLAIDNNRQTKKSYEAELRQANQSADTLSKVMAMHASNPKGFNEREAVQMVWQERRMNSLARNEAKNAQNEAAKMQFEEKALQHATNEIKSRFKPGEATVRQEGGDIVVQLNSLNFPVGKSEIPKKADPLLTKTQAIISDFKPAKVVVQGHADGTGSDKINEPLSEKRAESVASYLEKNGEIKNVVTEGKGSEMPLASNSNKKGRAQNRRSDIILTPSDSSF